MLHFPGGDQFLDRARNVLNWHVGIDAVLVEQIDLVDAQTLERSVADFFYVRRAAVKQAGALRDVKTELGCDHDLIACILQRLSNDLLVGKGSVDFGGIKKVLPALDALANERHGFAMGKTVAIAEIQAHAAEADGRDMNAAAAKFTLLHNKIPWAATARFRVEKCSTRRAR
jgi:hypothetical protein